MSIIRKSAQEKEKGFVQFLLDRNPSEKFIRTYTIYLKSSVVRKYTQGIAKTQDIFQIADKEDLLDVYDAVKLDDDNIRLHNVYSGAVSAYIKFLEGRTLRIKAGEKGKEDLRKD